MKSSRKRSDRELPPGAGYLRAKVADPKLTVFTYRPDHASPSGILFLFDGLKRDAEGIRDRAVALAERTGLVTFAPLMDRRRFPRWRYDLGGVIRDRGMAPRDDWTAPLLQRLVDWARQRAGAPKAPLYLFGHSAGGQMLSRVCAYSPLSGTQRIIVTNPSVYVAPTLDEPAPYGFGGAFPRKSETVARLQVYLALPMTIYLGRKDTGARYLAKSAAAMQQGANRLERGRFVFESGRKLAARKGWAFNWQLVEASGVGHSSRAMLDHPACALAFGFGPVPAAPRERRTDGSRTRRSKETGQRAV